MKFFPQSSSHHRINRPFRNRELDYFTEIRTIQDNRTNKLPLACQVNR